MNNCNSLKRHAVPYKFERNPATSAIAESGEAVRIGTGCREKNIKSGVADGPHPLAIGKQRQAPG